MSSPVEVDIAAAGEAGFDGVELWWTKVRTYLETHAVEQLRELMAKYRVTPVGVCAGKISPFRDTEARRAQFAEAVRVTAALDAKRFAVTCDGQPARLSQADAMAALADELAHYARIAGDHGVQICLEAVGRHSLVDGPAQCIELIEAIGAPAHVGLVMDTFHYFKSRVPLEQIRQIPRDRLLLIHINDTEDQPLDELTDAHRNFPGLGVIPLEAQLGAALATGYDGALSLETFRPDYWQRPADEVAVEALAACRNLLTRLDLPHR